MFLSQWEQAFKSHDRPATRNANGGPKPAIPTYLDAGSYQIE
jgi:hypothetical protein